MIDEFVPISPINFFQFELSCHKLEESLTKLSSVNLKKLYLPNFSELNNEEHFADIAMGWNNEGIEIQAIIHAPFKKSIYPEIQKGDCLELFFDTRNLKTTGYNTRFCHHFFFLPEPLEGIQAGELTRFRNEDMHELCQPKDLKVVSQIKLTSYTLNIKIPSNCLHGYDPDQFKQMGFTYRVNRYQGSPQHFSVLTDDYQIEQQPSLWSSMRLI